MAALVAGVQYGLSSHSNFPENKSLIFVKLTDSAQRAIEDFLRNGSTTNQNPTIQFLGNEGQLSFPSTQSSHGSAGFTFSLSGNQDIEGPQGGFECIQQTGPKSLESLGTLPWKMRIQANDDVYETTRHRMAVAEENNKNKCTRVIKANGPDIGRKVKVKAVGRTIPPITNTRHRESTSIPTSSNQSSRPLAPVQPPVSSTTLMSSSSSTYKAIKSNNPPSARQHEKKCSDIMRRPLRERLIHLLALRPYKRPELYDRINKEGIKERDRSTTTTLLKQVACMKDNTYHLHRHVWNDVQEDWPFYTEQEKAMLKRRKPQNLTPPGSSDGGSSGSGQSPNSTHPGSPPAISAPPPGLMSHKRPGYYQSADGLQTKRPRISHFRKSDTGGSGSGSNGGNNSSANNNNNNSNNSNSRGENVRTTGGSLGPMSGAGGLSSASVVSGSGLVNGSAASDMNGWDHRQQQQQQQQQQPLQQQQQQQQLQQQQQRDRGDWRTERTTTNSEVLRNYSSTKMCLTPTSDSEDNVAMTSSNQATSLSNISSNNLGSNHHSHNNNSSNNHHHNHNYNNHSSVNSTSSKASLVNDNNYTRIEFVKSLSNSATSSANLPNTTTNTTTTTTTNNPIERRDERQSSGSNSLNNSSSSSFSSFSSSSSSSSGFSSATSRSYERERDRERERERNNRERTELADNSVNNPQNNAYNNLNNLPSSRYNPNSANNLTNPNNTKSTGSSASNNYSPTSPTITSTSKNADYPDYHTYFTTISSTEQRRRYKDEFNADYEEYRRLHAQVAKVSKRFAQLEERRRKELENGNRGKIEEIELQIWQEYNDTKSDPVHKETKKRFDYLHEKLSHLKRLVHEYDMKNSAGNGATDKILTVRNGVVDADNSANLRY